MTRYPAKYTLLAIAIFSLITTSVISYIQYRRLEFTDAYPKSVTWITPYNAFSPQTTMAGDGKVTDGVAISYLGLAGNGFILFSLLTFGLTLTQNISKKG